MWKFKIDKQKHLIAGFAVAFLAGFASIWLAVVLLTFVAIGKEIRDEIVYGGFSLPDFVYTLAGGSVAILIHIIQ